MKKLILKQNYLSTTEHNLDFNITDEEENEIFSTSPVTIGRTLCVHLLNKENDKLVVLESISEDSIKMKIQDKEDIIIQKFRKPMGFELTISILDWIVDYSIIKKQFQIIKDTFPIARIKKSFEDIYPKKLSVYNIETTYEDYTQIISVVIATHMFI